MMSYPWSLGLPWPLVKEPEVWAEIWNPGEEFFKITFLISFKNIWVSVRSFILIYDFCFKELVHLSWFSDNHLCLYLYWPHFGNLYPSSFFKFVSLSID